MKIGIVGLGVVGDAVYDGLSHIGHELFAYDVKQLDTSIQTVINTEIVFVCVPTDTDINGECNTKEVELVVNQLQDCRYKGIIAIKSTVIPGTTQMLINKYSNYNICCIPEFLRQKCARTDFFDHHDVLVIGTEQQTVADIVIRAHGHIPKSTQVITPTEAEIVKYFNNVHNALEVVFANAMYEISKKLNANYQSVLTAVSKRSNINKKYLQCSEHYQGFGGHCLPKDTTAWANLAKKLDVKVKIFDSIIQDNQRYK
jgi:UDPglucose 6-dehydrogenase